MTFCDLTQSYSEMGGGVRTYLTEKRKYIEANSHHKHVLIIPGPIDRVTRQGRHVTIEIASPRVPGSPNYRLLIRSKSVIRALRSQCPDVIECHDAYNLPWAAIAYRRDHPQTLLVAAYHTDFPTVYVETLSRKFIGAKQASHLKAKAYNYASKLYGQFDRVFALNDDMAERLSGLGVGYVHRLSLGTDTQVFSPDKADEAWRRELKGSPILVYAGRLDKEKQANVVLEAFMSLPCTMNAHLVMIGDGNLKEALMKRSQGKSVTFTGFVRERETLAKLLASSDIYVSAMAHETFGISIIEAQASGLPVIGVKAGAMIERVPSTLGHLGPVGDAKAMALAIERLWRSEQISDIGKNAREHVLKNYSWNRTFLSLFEKVYTDERLELSA
ncbi:glycosyltransferase [Litorimonas taeanensis]|nr:glycosyltransferase [Litorimonas taeanensis]